MAMESSKLGSAGLSTSERQRTYRALRAVLLTAVLLLAIATYSLWRQYVYTRPSLMNQDTGEIHELYAGNWVVYVTRSDQFWLFGLAAAAAACLAGAVALDTFVLGKNTGD